MKDKIFYLILFSVVWRTAYSMSENETLTVSPELNNDTTTTTVVVLDSPENYSNTDEPHEDYHQDGQQNFKHDDDQLQASTTRFPNSIFAPEIDSNMDTALRSWDLLAKFTPQTLDTALQTLWPRIFETSASRNISEQCRASSLKLVQSIRQLKNWAIRMLDSTGKFPSGILEGTLTDFGSYAECLNTVATDDHNTQNALFFGQYCTVLLKPHLEPTLRGINALKRVVDSRDSSPSDTVLSNGAEPSQYFYLTNFRMGVCTPSTCTKDEIQEIAEAALNNLKWSVNISRCEVKEHIQLDSGQLAVTIIFSVIGILVLVGTTMDYFFSAYYRRRMLELQDSPEKPEKGFKVKIEKILLGFSLFSNVKKVLKTTNTARSLPFVHGIRFLSISWIILANTYGFTNLSSVRRMKNVIEATKDVTFQTIVNGWVAVDSFFFLGGLMIAYSMILHLEDKSEKINVLRLIFHRYWRLTPTLMMAVASLILLPVFGSGPKWYETINSEVEICRKNWWATLLHISNWRNLNHLCYGPSWYLCVDFQLYLVSIIVLFLLSRKPIIGISIMLALLSGSSALVAYLTITKDFAPSMVPFSPDQEWVIDMMYYIHTKPYTHIGSYCIGIATGYLLRKVQVIKMHPVFQITGWIIATSSGIAVLYGAYDWNNGHKPSTMESALYSSCHRIAWALGLAWTVFMCANGYSGTLNSFLSWKLFVPLSRMTFAAYLLHPLVIQFRSGTVKERIYFSHYDMAYLFMGHMGLTFGLAFVFAVAFEYPFKNLEKVLLQKKASSNLRIDPLGSTTQIVQSEVESTQTCCCEDTAESIETKKAESENGTTKEQQMVSRL